MHSQVVNPSLDHAYARIGRTEHHLPDLQSEIETFWRSANYEVSIPMGTTGIFSDATPAKGLPHPLISILIGETIYNLRAALDYLIHELALLDSGNIQQKTQFPLEDMPTDPGRLNDWQKRWANGTHKMLTGVSLPHQARIRQVQPFAGCTWTATLRELSNPDKHKTLIVVIPEAKVSIKFGSDKVQTIRFSEDDSMKVKGQVSRQILFDDGSPVLETLQVLQHEVTDVLDTFRPEFK